MECTDIKTLGYTKWVEWLAHWTVRLLFRETSTSLRNQLTGMQSSKKETVNPVLGEKNTLYQYTLESTDEKVGPGS